MTSVLFQGGEKLISSGAMDGQIKIWDLRKTYTNLKQDPLAFHVFPYPGQGIRKHGKIKTFTFLKDCFTSEAGTEKYLSILYLGFGDIIILLFSKPKIARFDNIPLMKSISLQLKDLFLK